MNRISALCTVCVSLVLISSGYADDKPLLEASFLDRLIARPIGPANMGGRVVDLAVVESRPGTMYVASASGGL